MKTVFIYTNRSFLNSKERNIYLRSVSDIYSEQREKTFSWTWDANLTVEKMLSSWTNNRRLVTNRIELINISSEMMNKIGIIIS